MSCKVWENILLKMVLTSFMLMIIIPKRVLDNRVFCLGGLAWRLLLQGKRWFCMLYIVKVYFNDIWYANEDLVVCVPIRLDQIFSRNMFINGLALHVLYMFILLNMDPVILPHRPLWCLVVIIILFEDECNLINQTTCMSFFPFHICCTHDKVCR